MQGQASVIRPQPGPDSALFVEPFTPFSSYDAGAHTDADRLGHDPSVDAVFRRVVNEIAATEGPVLLGRLTRQTFACFRVYEITPERAAWLYTVLPKARLHRDPGGLFLWPETVRPGAWDGFRRTARPTDRRPGEITVDEFANALVHELARNPDGIELDLLQRAALLALGHSRLSHRTRDRMGLAAELTVREHRVKRRGMRFFPLRNSFATESGPSC